MHKYRIFSSEERVLPLFFFIESFARNETFCIKSRFFSLFIIEYRFNEWRTTAFLFRSTFSSLHSSFFRFLSSIARNETYEIKFFFLVYSKYGIIFSIENEDFFFLPFLNIYRNETFKIKSWFSSLHNKYNIQWKTNAFFFLSIHEYRKETFKIKSQFSSLHTLNIGSAVKKIPIFFFTHSKYRIIFNEWKTIASLFLISSYVQSKILQIFLLHPDIIIEATSAFIFPH